MGVTDEHEEIGRQVKDDPQTDDHFPVDYPPPGDDRVLKPDPERDEAHGDERDRRSGGI